MSVYGNGNGHNPPGGVGQIGLPLSNDPVQMGLGALMGVDKTPGKYAKNTLREAALDALKHACLGMGVKVTEEVASVRLALEAAQGEHESKFLDRLTPADVREIVSADPAMMALDAGVHLTVVADLWPHVLAEECGPRIKRVQAWIKARLQIRLLSRFEGDPSTAGLAALKLWDEDRRSVVDIHTARDALAEPTLRDVVVDDDNLLHLNLLHVTRQRTPAGTGEGT